MSQHLRTGGGLVLVAAVLLGLAGGSVRAGPPHPLADLAGTVVYIRDGNIWLFVPATGRLMPVTRDGNYRSPSLADDGTIGAIQRLGGRSHFVTISLAGRKRAFPPGELINVIHADLSPDGRVFAFDYVIVSPLGANPSRVGVTFADHWGASGIAGGRWGLFSSSYYHPRWMTRERLILSGRGAWPYLVRGPGSGWEDSSSPYKFNIPGLRYDYYDVARSGNRFVVHGATWREEGYSEKLTGWHSIVYRPARPEEQQVVELDLHEMRACRGDTIERFGGGRCAVGWVPDGGFPLQGEPRGAAAAPDGRAIAFADDRGLLVTGPVGPAMRAYVVDPRGSEPEWSPFALTR